MYLFFGFQRILSYNKTKCNQIQPTGGNSHSCPFKLLWRSLTRCSLRRFQRILSFSVSAVGFAAAAAFKGTLIYKEGMRGEPLPEREELHELSSEKRRCLCCGKERSVIGEDRSSEYDLIPEHVVKIVPERNTDRVDVRGEKDRKRQRLYEPEYGVFHHREIRGGETEPPVCVFSQPVWEQCG
jgi:hypothetical protein